MNDTQSVDAMTVVREAAPVDGDPVRMLPAEAYTSAEVLAWERRHLGRRVRLAGQHPHRVAVDRSSLADDCHRVDALSVVHRPASENR